jgi:K+-sensing histidine kinase KdpD
VKITIDITILDGGVKLLYRDFGKGISKEQKDDIFVPFLTYSQSSENSGLGLSICKSIVENTFLGSIDARLPKKKGIDFFYKFSPEASLIKVIRAGLSYV